MTVSLLLLGIALASWITLRNPGYRERFNWWPTWWEWSVGTTGVVLIGVAIGRVIWASVTG